MHGASMSGGRGLDYWNRLEWEAKATKERLPEGYTMQPTSDAELDAMKKKYEEEL